MSAVTPPTPGSFPHAGGTDPHLVSFVVRFVCDTAPSGSDLGGRQAAAGWHGLIRHVQSDAERYFTHWADAVAFIGQFVTVAEPPHNA